MDSVPETPLLRSLFDILELLVIISTIAAISSKSFILRPVSHGFRWFAERKRISPYI